MINLAANYNQLGPPTGFRAFLRGLNQQAIYESYAGDNMGKIDTSEIASFFGVGKDSALITTGSTEALDLITRLTSQPTAYIPQPTFWEYRFFAELQGKHIVTVPLAGTAFVKEQITQRITGQPGVVYICNPNNPSGHQLSKEDLISLVDSYPTHTFVIDETYLMFSPEYHSASLASLAASRENIFVVTSLSKIFALPGLRIGILVASPTNVGKIRRLKVPYSTLPLQVVASHYLLNEESAYLQRSQAVARRDIAAFSTQLKRMGYQYTSSDSNFVFIDGGRPGLCAHLEKNDIIARSGAEFGPDFQNYVRVRACGSRSIEGRQLLGVLESFIRQADIFTK